MSGIEDEITCRVVDGLERLGIAYMLVGSYASNVFGRPRDSHDADIVADIREEHVPAVAAEFSRDFVVNADSIRECVRLREMFNLIPQSGVFKVDIIPLRDRPFDQEEFRRRVAIEAWGRRIFFARPEDVVLSKLRWYRKGGEASARQLEDARDVLAAQRDHIDAAYLRRWAKDLGVADLLARLWGEAGA